MELRIEKAEASEAAVVDRLLQFTLYEGGMDPDPDGRIDWGEPLERFFTRPDFVPLLFREDDQLVGFALVKLNRRPTGPDGKTPVESNFIEEFCILRPRRRRGLGTRAFDVILERYPGRWMTSTWPGGEGFWHHVVMDRPEVNGREYKPDENKGYPGQWVWVVEAGEEVGGRSG